MISFFFRKSRSVALILILVAPSVAVEKQPACVDPAASGQSDATCEEPDEDSSNLLQTHAIISDRHVSMMQTDADNKAMGQTIKGENDEKNGETMRVKRIGWGSSPVKAVKATSPSTVKAVKATSPSTEWCCNRCNCRDKTDAGPCTSGSVRCKSDPQSTKSDSGGAGKIIEQIGEMIPKVGSFYSKQLDELMPVKWYFEDKCSASNCKMITMGRSIGANSKTITTQLSGYICPSTVSKTNWAVTGGYAQVGDTFSITQNGNQLTARRSDSGAGWGLDLKFECCPLRALDFKGTCADISNGPFFITSHRNQQLQDNKGAVKLTGNKVAHGWEGWTLSDAGDGQVFIKSHRSQYLQDNEDKGAVKLYTDALTWEKWTLSDAGYGQVYIKSHRGKHLEDREGTVGLHDHSGLYQKWKITKGNGGSPVCLSTVQCKDASSIDMQGQCWNKIKWVKQNGFTGTYPAQQRIYTAFGLESSSHNSEIQRYFYEKKPTIGCKRPCKVFSNAKESSIIKHYQACRKEAGAKITQNGITRADYERGCEVMKDVSHPSQCKAKCWVHYQCTGAAANKQKCTEEANRSGHCCLCTGTCHRCDCDYGCAKTCKKYSTLALASYPANMPVSNVPVEDNDKWGCCESNGKTMVDKTMESIRQKKNQGVDIMKSLAAKIVEVLGKDATDFMDWKKTFQKWINKVNPLSVPRWSSMLQEHGLLHEVNVTGKISEEHIDQAKVDLSDEAADERSLLSSRLIPGMGGAAGAATGEIKKEVGKLLKNVLGSVASSVPVTLKDMDPKNVIEALENLIFDIVKKSLVEGLEGDSTKLTCWPKQCPDQQASVADQVGYCYCQKRLDHQFDVVRDALKGICNSLLTAAADAAGGVPVVGGLVQGAMTGFQEFSNTMDDFRQDMAGSSGDFDECHEIADMENAKEIAAIKEILEKK